MTDDKAPPSAFVNATKEVLKAYLPAAPSEPDEVVREIDEARRDFRELSAITDKIAGIIETTPKPTATWSTK